jgi:hypothetical protein
MSRKIFGDVEFNDGVTFSSNMAVAAAAAGTQVAATQLTSTMNAVTSAANDYASVKLLAAPKPGTFQIVQNDTTYLLNVFPGSGGQIQTIGVDTALTLNPKTAGVREGETFYFLAISATQWITFAGVVPNLYQFRLISGIISLYGQTSIAGDTILYSWLYRPNNYSAPLTAFAGGGQASATAITSQSQNVIGTCATNGDSVKLVAVGAIGGATLGIFNNTANTASLYPAVGGQIDALGLNAAYSLRPGEYLILHALDNLSWISVSSKQTTGLLHSALSGLTSGDDHTQYILASGTRAFTGAISNPGAGASSERWGASAVAAGASGTSIGNAASAANTNSTAIGASANALAVDSTCIGKGATCTAGATSSTVIGSGAAVTGASSTYCTVIGTGAVVSALNGTAIGLGATQAGQGLAIGYLAAGSATRATALGRSATASAQASIAIGYLAKVGTVDSIVVGQSLDASSASATGLVFIGTHLTNHVTASNCTLVGHVLNPGAAKANVTAMGYGFVGGGAGATGLGSGVTVSGDNSMALGYLASTSTFTNSVALGKSATATANNQLMVGGASNILNTVTHGYITGDQVLVSPQASTPVAVAAADSNKYFTNEGATAQIVFNLPTAAAGLRYTFICQDVDGLRVNANTADTIRAASTVSASAGYIETFDVGTRFELTAINATEWFVTAIVGAVTVV